MDFGAQSSFAAPYRLVFAGFFWSPHCADAPIADMVAAVFSLNGVALDDRVRQDALTSSRPKFESFLLLKKVTSAQDESVGPSHGGLGEKWCRIMGLVNTAAYSPRSLQEA
jgi:hypothetical protein